MRSFVFASVLSLGLLVGLAACDSDPNGFISEICEDGALVVDTLERGTSPSRVRSSSVIVASYVGTLVATRDTFDASSRATLALSGSVDLNLLPSITGFRQGLTGAVVGDSLRLTIPPDLAYGGRDVVRNGAVSIPACSVVQFDVRVLDIVG